MHKCPNESCVAFRECEGFTDPWIQHPPWWEDETSTSLHPQPTESEEEKYGQA